MGATETGEPAPENLTPEGQNVVQKLDAVLDALTELGKTNKEVREEQSEFTDEVLKRLKQTDERFTKIDRHLGYLRGAHAANVMRRNASLIADGMGYQVIAVCPQESLIDLAKIAHNTGKPSNEVGSFREADMVLLVRDNSGLAAYLAVEASFTVDSKDIRRAKRNAEYLHEFTGLSAKGVVAGVDITPAQEQNAITNGVHCYRIPVKDLEADQLPTSTTGS